MSFAFRFFIVFFLTVSSAYGQTTNLILTAEQNSKWLDSLRTLTMDKQLPIIRNCLLADTNVYVRQHYADRIKVVEEPGNKVYGEGKPTLIISSSYMIIDNKTETKKIIQFADLLTTNNIKEVSILSPNDPKAAAFYGSAALDGIIIMTLTKPKYLKKFKRLKLKRNY